MSLLDRESKQFLDVCRRFGGEARSDVIRREAGLSRGQRDRRFKKLEKEGYIITRTADEPLNGGGIPPRIAVLTDKARREIDDGLLEEAEDEDDVEDGVKVSATEFEEFQARLNTMENRVNALSQALLNQESDKEIGTRASGADVLGDYADVEEELNALRAEVDQIGELDEQIEYVYKWIGQAERYAKASRYLFEQMGFDFQAALDDVDSGEHQTEFTD